MTKNSVVHSEIAGVIEIHHSKPMVSSLKIAELFERRHDSVLRAIRKVEASNKDLRIRAEMSSDERGRDRPVYWLDEEASLVVMPFIGGQHAIAGQRKLVKAYLYYRDAFKNPPRTDLVRSKRDASRVLTDAIIDMRTEQGEETTRVHYMSEQKLCNWVVCGEFKAIDEASLSNENVELLRLVRERNAALIAAEIPYDERKPRLAKFAIRQRTKLLTNGTSAD
jgi:Rha family phage regulatory protein